MVRAVLFLAFVTAVGVGAGYFVAAGRAPAPAIEILQPTRLVGRTAVFEAVVETPKGQLSALKAVVEQDDRRYPLFSLDQPEDAEVRQDDPDRVRITRTFDRASHPELDRGPARVVVSATRPVLFGLRERSASVTANVEVRLDPPRLSIVSFLHYVNHGGSELVVYRVTPPDAESGVQVGNRRYRGYPASGAGLSTDDTLHVAFFALLHDQDLTTPIAIYARDEAGNESQADFDHRLFPREFRRTQIQISNSFLRRVVPAIVNHVPDLADDEPDGSDADWLDLFLFINGELRQRNRATVAALSEDSSPHLLWDGPFRQLANSQVESGFLDHRTYLYDGDEIDQQVHLGFDLASTANAPIGAAAQGAVVYADYLGIFGNCVIIDHGMGLQSLYAHLSSIDVSPGDDVGYGQQLGRSGQTGLASGDHLHFTMLHQGHPVTPVEWWDPQWIEDRVMRKLREASSPR